MNDHLIPEPDSRPQPEKRPRSAAEESLIIYQSKVHRRYSALVRAMQAEAADGGPAADEPAPLSPAYEAFCRRVLGLAEQPQKYLVRKPFAAGGMGHLYYARDRDFGRTSVMKVIIPQLRQNELIIRSFVREARITGQLEHPNIIPVHDLGYHPDYGLFFTMKLVEGETLNDILQELETGHADYVRKYDLWTLLGIFRKVCDAVAFAHSRGIIHRDIKPANIMVGDYGEVLLMDWGLAKAVRRRPKDTPREGDFGEATVLGADDEVTGPFAVIKGSPGYMSPEQASGQTSRLDQRSDIFLLGATLYNILTFYPPYLGAEVDEVLEHARRCNYDPPEKSHFGDWQIPADLAQIVHRAMARNPRHRYQTVDELTRDLDDLIHGRMRYQRRTYQAGQLLLHEGEPGAESFIIESGKVEVFKGTGEHKVTLGILGAGEIVGEMALITQGPRSASVQALTRTRVLVLTDERFTENLKRLPTWMGKTIVALAQRLYEADRKLAQRPRGTTGAGS
jgi:serine/threonine-protein kinase